MLDPLHVEAAIRLSNFYSRAGQAAESAGVLERALTALQAISQPTTPSIDIPNQSAMTTTTTTTTTTTAAVVVSSPEPVAHDPKLASRIQTAALLVIPLARIYARGRVVHCISLHRCRLLTMRVYDVCRVVHCPTGQSHQTLRGRHPMGVGQP
jgi:hypothetical protein